MISTCPTCTKRFSSDRAFDKHRTGEYEQPGKPSTRRCRTTLEMYNAGMVCNPKTGIWGREAMKPERLVRKGA